MRKLLIFLAGVVLALGILTDSASAGFVMFSDDFSRNTTLSYTWVEEGGGGDNNPTNNYVYDPENDWVTIKTADNCNIRMGASLPTAIEAGHFEISFMPFQTYYVDGVVQMRLYGADGTWYSYHWDFARRSGTSFPGEQDVYRAHLEKWVGGVAVIEEVFVPSPDHYDLDVWHTLAMDFSPTSLGGYLDGNSVLTQNDPASSSIAITSFEIIFRQQDQRVNNILITASVPVPVPLPGSVLLGVWAVGLVGWWLRRSTC